MSPLRRLTPNSLVEETGLERTGRRKASCHTTPKCSYLYFSFATLMKANEICYYYTRSSLEKTYFEVHACRIIPFSSSPPPAMLPPAPASTARDCPFKSMPCRVIFRTDSTNSNRRSPSTTGPVRVAGATAPLVRRETGAKNGTPCDSCSGTWYHPRWSYHMDVVKYAIVRN